MPAAAIVLVSLALGAPWDERGAPFGTMGREAGSLPRALIVGVGGGETARVAHALAREGLAPEVCSPVGLPFLPREVSGWSRWSVVLLGPIPGGAGALTAEQQASLAEWVRTAGGGIVFVGGMDSFAGAGGRGGYAASPLAEVMPVACGSGDDHIARPERPRPLLAHELLEGLPSEWPTLGERNREPLHPSARALVGFEDGLPLLAIREVGTGRSAALLTAWGWPAQTEFTLWPGFARLWGNLAHWAGATARSDERIELPLRTEGSRIARPEGGRPVLASAGQALGYLGGLSIEERSLDFVARGKAWGFGLFHLWDSRPSVAARACAMAEHEDAWLAVFLPQVGPFARFRDGSRSGDGLPYDSPWHRVPDFYSGEWQAAFRSECAKLRAAIAGHEDRVPILWITNEPEIHREWSPWTRADFCLNTPASLRVLREEAQRQYGDVAGLREAWSREGEHEYAFVDWDDFERRVLDQLAADAGDGRVGLAAHRWILRFVTERWLPDWTSTARRIAEEEGLGGALFGARHNYNSAPDLALLPWRDLDIVGKNLYAERDSDAYLHETWDAFRASGLPVLMSEWGVQPALPPLGFVGGDEVLRAEQAVRGRAMAHACPWVVGDVWSNVFDIDFPWGVLDELGRPKPFVAPLGRVSTLPCAMGWNPLESDAMTVSPGLFAVPGLSVRATEGPPGREPGIEFGG